MFEYGYTKQEGSESCYLLKRLHLLNYAKGTRPPSLEDYGHGGECEKHVRLLLKHSKRAAVCSYNELGDLIENEIEKHLRGLSQYERDKILYGEPRLRLCRMLADFWESRELGGCL